MFTLTTSVSFAHPCDWTLNKLDKTSNSKLIKKWRCRLSWKTSEGIEGMEFVYFKKMCSRYEGGPVMDCGHVRTCFDDETKASVSSLPLYGDKKYMDSLCKNIGQKEKVYLLGSPDYFTPLPMQAWLVCKNQRVVNLVLKAPDGKTKECQLPPSK